MSDFLLCIYIGNQETSAALFNTRTKERHYLEIQPGYWVIPSALSIVKKGEDSNTYIGVQALYHMQDASYFKNRIDCDIDSTSSPNRFAFTCFLQCVYTNILKSYQYLKDESAQVVLITCRGNRKLIREIAETAGIPVSNVYDSTATAFGYFLLSPLSNVQKRFNRSLIIEIDEQDILFSIIGRNDGILRSSYKMGTSYIVREFYDYILSHPENYHISQLDEVIKKEKTSSWNSVGNLVAHRIAESYYDYAIHENKMTCFFDYDILTGGLIQGFGGCRFEHSQIDTILSDTINDFEKLLSFVKCTINYDEKKDVSFLIGGSHIHSTLRDVFRKNFPNVISSADESPFLYINGFMNCSDVMDEYTFLDKDIKFVNLFSNINMKPITEKTEFIIGIDFGHGETSARFYNLQNQDQDDIDILPGQKVIKSAVAILRQEGVETICVGDSAIQKAPMAIDFQVSFKKRPSEMKPDERKRMVSFMKGVYEGILDRHPDYKTRDHRVFIARPSQDKIWKNEEDAYIAIAEEAGLPVAGIQKESRAAYFRARTQPDSKIDNQVEKGVLIVDFGSSTIDFTYLNKELSQPIDDGANLGANAVETSLLKYALSHPQDATMPEFAKIYGNETNSNAYNQLLYKFRVAKEEFYGKKLPNFSVGIDYSLVTSAERQQLTGWGGITLKRSDIRKILESEEYGNYIPTVDGKAARV